MTTPSQHTQFNVTVKRFRTTTHIKTKVILVHKFHPEMNGWVTFEQGRAKTVLPPWNPFKSKVYDAVLAELDYVRANPSEYHVS